MQLYNFERLINKYSVDCQLVEVAKGNWKDGEWQEGEKTTADISGAVVPISEKIIQNSGGTYKQGDCVFITTRTIDTKGEVFITHSGKIYKLQESTDYSDFADFNTYVARRVSSFDTAGNDKKGND